MGKGVYLSVESVCPCMCDVHGRIRIGSYAQRLCVCPCVMIRVCLCLEIVCVCASHRVSMLETI